MKPNTAAGLALCGLSLWCWCCCGDAAGKFRGHATFAVKEGDRVKVKVMGHDDRGKVKLSMRVVDQQTGADLEKTPAPEPAEPAE
jgi:hypothetical protein